MLTNLSDFFDDDWFNTRMMRPTWMPAVNVIDNEADYQLKHKSAKNIIFAVRSPKYKLL